VQGGTAGLGQETLGIEKLNKRDLFSSKGGNDHQHCNDGPAEAGQYEEENPAPVQPPDPGQQAEGRQCKGTSSRTARLTRKRRANRPKRSCSKASRQSAMPSGANLSGVNSSSTSGLVEVGASKKTAQRARAHHSPARVLAIRQIGQAVRARATFDAITRV